MPETSIVEELGGFLLEQLSFKVAEIEGPLDLILQLIAKHKLNIYDIEITKLLKQYMEYIKDWKEKNLDISSEFLDMASRLVYIKSVSLLPKHEELEEQLKKELTGQLIEYSLCKQVANLLKEKFIGSEIFARTQVDIPVESGYSGRHNPKQLLKAYLVAIGKIKNLPLSSNDFEPIISRRIVPVSSKIILIMQRLYQQKMVGFLSLFSESMDRSDIVATFLAILELVKGRRILIGDDDLTILIEDSLPSESLESIGDSIILSAESGVPEGEN